MFLDINSCFLKVISIARLGIGGTGCLVVHTNYRTIKLYQFYLGLLLLSHIYARRFPWSNFAPHERIFIIHLLLAGPRPHLKLTASVNIICAGPRPHLKLTASVNIICARTHTWWSLISCQRKFVIYFFGSQNTFCHCKHWNDLF